MYAVPASSSSLTPFFQLLVRRWRWRWQSQPKDTSHPAAEGLGSRRLGEGVLLGPVGGQGGPSDPQASCEACRGPAGLVPHLPWTGDQVMTTDVLSWSQQVLTPHSSIFPEPSPHQNFND